MVDYVFLKSGLVLHFIGIVLMVGFTFASLVTYNQIWKFLPANRTSAVTIVNTSVRFQFWQMLGGILIVTGGIMMMMIYQDAIMQAFWFKIKMVALAAIILNFVIIGRPSLSKLKLLLNDSAGGYDNLSFDLSRLHVLKMRVLLFFFLQLLLFLIIFILAAFRFN